MSTLEYIDRRGTDCEKWDEQTPSFGEEGLHAMWVADMDFKVPACVQKALHEYVDMGAFGYMSIHQLGKESSRSGSKERLDPVFAWRNRCI